VSELICQEKQGGMSALIALIMEKKQVSCHCRRAKIFKKNGASWNRLKWYKLTLTKIAVSPCHSSRMALRFLVIKSNPKPGLIDSLVGHLVDAQIKIFISFLISKKVNNIYIYIYIFTFYTNYGFEILHYKRP
jgi:hypothetical protein